MTSTLTKPTSSPSSDSANASPNKASPYVRNRFTVALVLSLGLHLLFAGAAARGWHSWMPWFGSAKEQPAPVVAARLVKPAPPPAVPLPVPVPQVSSQPVSTPKAQSAPKPRTQNPALARNTVEKPTETVSSASEPAPAPTPAALPVPTQEPQTAQAPTAPTSTTQSAPAAAPPRGESPLPLRAKIFFELTLESNNFKVWSVQNWEGSDYRFNITLSAEAKMLFVKLGAIRFETSGRLTDDGLALSEAIDQRNNRITNVAFNETDRTALVTQHDGNKKTLSYKDRPKPVDAMSLAYELAMNSDLPIGSSYLLLNRDNLEEIRLEAVRNETLNTETGTLATRFYEFKRVGAPGGAQIWLAPEKKWLPARIRIIGRDGGITLTVTKYEYEP